MLTLNRLQFTVKKFLGKEVNILGVVPEDAHVKKLYQGSCRFTVHFHIQRLQEESMNCLTAMYPAIRTGPASAHRYLCGN